ncbi:GH15411 [Drosophila grimshawi]|uniref:GH15411 n=1 Tax=Drosophila grimshawi TaxID=7222 RepID=B4JUN0_DROGR|nr:GH15411 [Drosophila grimshawi]
MKSHAERNVMQPEPNQTEPHRTALHRNCSAPQRPAPLAMFMSSTQSHLWIAIAIALYRACSPISHTHMNDAQWQRHFPLLSSSSICELHQQLKSKEEAGTGGGRCGTMHEHGPSCNTQAPNRESPSMGDDDDDDDDVV